MNESNTPLTIVTYHYVRPADDEFKNLKILDLQKFQRQIEYFKKHYSFVTMEDVADCIYENKKMPNNPILLTFDDGYNDHYTYVFPILKKTGISGSFFVPKIILEANNILYVNKIQFILAKLGDYHPIIEMITNTINREKNTYNLKDYSWYKNKLLREPERFDDFTVVFIKRMLQRELPVTLRHKIIDILFKKHVTNDEVGFFKTLYMSNDMIQEMSSEGMFFGGHGYLHEWMNSINSNDLDLEVQKSYQFCKSFGNKQKVMAICYPSNSYNHEVIEKFKSVGFKIGVKSDYNVNQAVLNIQNAMTLNRFDTNDFPQ